MRWTERQDAIAQRYCGTVIVLDDEIRKSAGEGEQLDPFFLKAKSDFENRGMLCDLRHVSYDFDDESKVNLIRQQLQRADTVVVDWYLGTGMAQQKDPKNALKVLDMLKSIGGFRFVIIHTRESPSNVIAHLRSKYDGSLKDVSARLGVDLADDPTSQVITEDDEVTTSSDSTPTTYQLGNSVYLSVVSKNNSSALPVDVTQFFANGLRAAFPDHLHWVGFDFAARIRELLPLVLEVLPIGTDVAVVFQALLQGKDELGDSLVECLADEIQELLRSNPLESAADETVLGCFIDRIKMHKPDYDATPTVLKRTCQYIHTGKGKSDFVKYFGTLPPEKEDDRKLAQRTLSQFIGKMLYPGASVDSNNSHEGYGALREHYQCSTEKRLYPGVVLKKDASSENDLNWLLCMSPACDCVRGDEQREYLFVEGKTLKGPEFEDANSVQTCLILGQHYVHVKWSSKWFKTIKSIPSKVEGYSFHGRLRDEFVHLLTQRVFGWQSRVGVNTSEFLRVIRERK